MIDAEMEVMASGVALQVMEFIGQKDFDYATREGSYVTEASELTAPSSFGVSGQCDLVAPIQVVAPYTNCSDLDDYHGMTLQEVPFLMQSDTIYFKVTASVQYVTDAGEETESKTFNKKVTVSLSQDEDQQFLLSPMTLSRVFSYKN
jgi:hypothetical protein